MDVKEIDGNSRPARGDHVAFVRTADGGLAWADHRSGPKVLDAASAVLLSVIDGATTLDELIAELETALGDVEEHDVATGVLVAVRRMGLEGFLAGREPLETSGRRSSLLYRQLTAWADHVAEAEANEQALAQLNVESGAVPCDDDHDHGHDHDDGHDHDHRAGADGTPEPAVEGSEQDGIDDPAAADPPSS